MSVGPRAGWVVGREQLALLFQGEMVRPSMYNCLTLIKGVFGGGGSVGARSPVSGGGLERGGGGGWVGGWWGRMWTPPGCWDGLF